jgi:hypothetical protein
LRTQPSGSTLKSIGKLEVFAMPDLKRVCLASAAALLLAAIAGAQTVAPFRVPRPMPPEIMPSSPDRLGAGIHVDLDNAQLRVARFKLPANDRLQLPLLPGSAGELIVAVTPVTLRTPSGTLRLDVGETRWLTGPLALQNLSAEECEFLLIQPKRN